MTLSPEAEIRRRIYLSITLPRPRVDVIQLFWGKSRFVLMSDPALKCENNAIFKQIYTVKLFIAFKMTYSCCFSFGENLDFPQFIQKKFYNINYKSSAFLSQKVVKS